MTINQLAKIGLAARKKADQLQRQADRWGDAHGYDDGVHFALNDAAEKMEDLFHTISLRVSV